MVHRNVVWPGRTAETIPSVPPLKGSQPRPSSGRRPPVGYGLLAARVDAHGLRRWRRLPFHRDKKSPAGTARDEAEWRDPARSESTGIRSGEFRPPATKYGPERSRHPAFEAVIFYGQREEAGFSGVELPLVR